MSEERLRQVEQLYHEALEHEPRQRAAFLDAACAGDEDLRREVESLLGYEEQAESFIETPAPQLAANRDQASDRQPTEAQKLPSLGSYQLLSLLLRSMLVLCRREPRGRFAELPEPDKAGVRAVLEVSFGERI